MSNWSHQVPTVKIFKNRHFSSRLGQPQAQLVILLGQLSISEQELEQVPAGTRTGAAIIMTYDGTGAGTDPCQKVRTYRHNLDWISGRGRGS